MSVGNNVKRLRRARNLNQGELADKAGLGVNIISKIENDDSDPKTSTIYKLMDALNCTADEIFLDAEKSNMSVIMKSQFEMASTLPDENKRVLIELIDKYCKAIAYDAMLSDSKNKFLGLSNIRGKTEDVLG